MNKYDLKLQDIKRKVIIWDSKVAKSVAFFIRECLPGDKESKEEDFYLDHGYDSVVYGDSFKIHESPVTGAYRLRIFHEGITIASFDFNILEDRREDKSFGGTADVWSNVWNDSGALTLTPLYPFPSENQGANSSHL